jgi:hypothetical protein
VWFWFQEPKPHPRLTKKNRTFHSLPERKRTVYGIFLTQLKEYPGTGSIQADSIGVNLIRDIDMDMY